jgi:LCP family protein required for cell wall assembly
VLGRILVGTLLLALALALAAAGGAYLWFHQSVAKVRAHSPDVKAAQKQLNVPLPGHAAIALVVGYDQRAGKERSDVSRSDTIMLLRADPRTKTISMLSFPRDLVVPVYCNNGFVANDRINSAYARCKATGTLDTVRNLTKLPINYLITVNFHGFKQIVDDVGGVWLDIDRRYYNKNVGTAATNFANINLQPGYQQLAGGNALDFVRYRHTDSDFYRLARQQAFVRALKEQVSQHFNPLDLPKIVSAITDNVEVGAKRRFSDSTVLSYAKLALTLPGGHFLQVRIDNVSGYSELAAPASAIQKAVTSFINPDVTVSKVANATALGKKVRIGPPPPQKTSVTVLNGNGVAGSAANANYLLAQRGYQTVLPKNGAAANAPVQNYFHSQIFFDPKQDRARAAAQQLQKVVTPSEVHPLPKNRALRALDPGSMLLLVTGETFHDELSPPPAPPEVPKRQPAFVRFDAESGGQLLQPLVHRVPFKLYVPTILEKSSLPDTLPGDTPARLYTITHGRKAVRLVFRTGANEFWGIEETDWPDAPILADRSFQHDLGGREFQLYYSGPHLHMVVLRRGDRSYWVVNTLLDSLSNETMIAIAKGLKPMAGK